MLASCSRACPAPRRAPTLSGLALPPSPRSYKEPEKSADLGTETEAATDQQLCYHVLGRPQSEDVVVWAMPDNPTWMSSAEVSDDGK